MVEALNCGEGDARLAEGAVVLRAWRNGRIFLHERWWRAFWSRSHVRIGAGANASKAPDAAQVSMQYANARYLQIIQSRGQWPIKFVRPQH